MSIISRPPEAPVDIWNLALDLVGQETVSSIEAPTKPLERLGQRWYDTVRRAVLREQVWNFAQKYEVLLRAGDAEDGVFEDAYNLPNDFIRLNYVGEDPRDPRMAFKIASDNQIYASNGDTLPIYFNTDVTEVTTFDPLFVDYLALRLAERTGFKITKKPSTYELISNMIMKSESKVTGVDGQEVKPIRRQESKYLNARRRGSGYDNRYYP